MKIRNIFLGVVIYKIIKYYIESRKKVEEDNINIDQMFKKEEVKRIKIKKDNEINRKEEIDRKEEIEEEQCMALMPIKHFKKSNYKIDDIYEKIRESRRREKPIKKIEISYKMNKENENIILEGLNGYMVESFESREDKRYRIKCRFKTINVKKIKLIISDDRKRFVYDTKNNMEDINTFGFILENNKFGNKMINIYFIFDQIEDEECININNYDMNIIEYEGNSNNNCILIINMNEKNEPIFGDSDNIIDNVLFSNDNEIYFI